MRRKLLMFGVPVLVVLIAAGFAGWWFIIRDDAPAAVKGVEEQFATSDTTVAAPATTAPAAATTASGSDATTAAATTAAPTTAGATTADGTWTVRQSESVFAGYRIQEEFVSGALSSTAVGRSPGVTGTIEVDGSTVTNSVIEVDLTQLTSDSDQRDERIRTGGLETNSFPTATFALTAPIDLGAVPTVGQVFAVTATGDLTMHGVTQPISLPLEARWTGDTIDLTGSVQVVLADYGISMEAFAGFVKVSGEGTIEMAVQFVRA